MKLYEHDINVTTGKIWQKCQWRKKCIWESILKNTDEQNAEEDG